MSLEEPEVQAAEDTIQRLRREHALEQLVGKAPAFLAAITALPTISRAQATVLLAGESGTGKELVARAIHYLSERDAFPFVPVNCGAFPDTLLEAELFGHERGAFTDAHVCRPGLLAQAEKGTLFLDEVDSLTPRAQVLLLRVLQDKRYRVLGSSVEHRADVRFIAATNVSLHSLVREGAFRVDLYHRLSVFVISLPALRDRREDILPLANYFITRYAVQGHPCPQLTPAAEVTLLSFDWPGNVRELENAIIRGINFAENGRIEPRHLGLAGVGPEPPSGWNPGTTTFGELKRRVIREFERDFLTRLMCEHGGNITRAARSVGKERRELGKLLKKHNLDRKGFASRSPRGGAAPREAGDSTPMGKRPCKPTESSM